MREYGNKAAATEDNAPRTIISQEIEDVDDDLEWVAFFVDFCATIQQKKKK